MGIGDEELGAELMLKSLDPSNQLKDHISHVVFFNAGEGSPSRGLR